MVADIITEKRNEIVELCRKYRVEQLDLFGSAVTERFDPETSDVDFIVRFFDEPSGILYRYVEFADALEKLLQREVDLLTERSVGSPEFRDQVNESRVMIYERKDDQAAA